MTPSRSTSSVPSPEVTGRQKRFFSRRLIACLGITLAVLLVAGITFAAQALSFTHAATPLQKKADHAAAITTINGLTKITMVGRTDRIIDAHGKTITVDPNPYGIAISDGSNGLKEGDILVTNIGNNDMGKTIVKFSAQKGPGHLFNITPSKATSGPADLAFNNETGSLWVSNKSGNDVQIFHPNGTLLTTITNPLFNHPWGMATNGGKVHGYGVSISFFVGNVIDATIDRIDVIPQSKGLPLFKVVQIGQLDKNGAATKIGLKWLPELKIGKRTLKDVLLAIDPVNNRIAAFEHSSTIDAKGAKGTGKGVTVFAGKPLNMPGGFAIDPFNGDLLVVNLMDNNLVEINMTSGNVIGVKPIDPVVVDGQGNGSALFGVAAIKDKGNLRVFFTDDNTNTLNALSAS
jgi:DNA-binding beta-propeller fold protein YncE